jgi:ParB family transcriptional regulator, chromosome partitioning protein
MGTKSSKEAHGAAGKGNLLLFDPDKIHLIVDKAHKLYDPRVELAPQDELVASIVYKGVVEPVVVWKDPETGQSCVVDGRQRVKAAREANKILRKRGEPPKLVPATVARGNAVAAMGTMVVANNHTPPTAMGQARMAERLLAEGYDEDAVATLLHCSKGALKNYLALLACTGAVRSAVESGRVPPTVAYKLSRLEPDEQRGQLEKMLKAAPGPKKRGSGKKMRAAAGEIHMRSRKEILAMRDNTRNGAWADALDWVLGKDIETAGVTRTGAVAEAGRTLYRDDHTIAFANSDVSTNPYELEAMNREESARELSSERRST